MRTLQAKMLLAFLGNGDPRLDSWNVGVVEASRGRRCAEPLGKAGIVRDGQSGKARGHFVCRGHQGIDVKT